ncbi:SsrA-binding protein [bacterium]|nr:SsrA-binding protein [bacterium]
MTKLAHNRKAAFNYNILEIFEAGLVLAGYEVKAIRAGKASLVGAYITINGNEANLVGATIAPYQPKNTPEDYDPERARKLLITKKELSKLGKELNTAGLTIVPISLYNKKNRVKLEFALVRGKKKADKRESLKEKDAKRSIERTLKNQ